MEKTVTMRMSEYEDLLTYRKAFNGGGLILVSSYGYGAGVSQYISHLEKDDAVNLLQSTIQKQRDRIEKLEAKKWWQI